MDYQENAQLSSETALSLSDIFKVLKQRWLIIGLVTALFFVIGFLYVKAQPDTYTAQSTYIVYAKDAGANADEIVGDDIIASLSAGDISRSKSFKLLYVEDLASNSTLPNTIRLWLAARYGYTEETLPSASAIRSMLSFSTDEESYFFFTASVKSTNKNLVMDVNAALTDIISDAFKSTYEYRLILAAVSGIQPLSATATDAEKAAFLAALLERGIACEDVNVFSADLAALNSRITVDETTVARLTSYAKYDATPIEGSSIYPRDASESPKASGTSSMLAIVAALVGFVLATAAFVLVKIFDTKIRSEEDLRKHCDYPTLAVIPAMHIHQDKGGKRS